MIYRHKAIKYIEGENKQKWNQWQNEKKILKERKKFTRSNINNTKIKKTDIKHEIYL